MYIVCEPAILLLGPEEIIELVHKNGTFII